MDKTLGTNDNDRRKPPSPFQRINAATTRSKFTEAERCSGVNHKQRYVAKAWLQLQAERRTIQSSWSRCFDTPDHCPEICSRP
ncbi:hypothetical protein L208DRAFT_1407672 [Tricholoma matsutake]|nr:hypothetical protein L208DRAFT_1407672 [Tricholoma matsutake 945]